MRLVILVLCRGQTNRILAVHLALPSLVERRNPLKIPTAGLDVIPNETHKTNSRRLCQQTGGLRRSVQDGNVCAASVVITRECGGGVGWSQTAEEPNDTDHSRVAWVGKDVGAKVSESMPVAAISATVNQAAP